MKSIAIVGAGIAGLSAAYELEKARRAGAELSYTIFESSHRIGGALHTAHRNGYVIELGADSFLSEKPWAFELCRELGIEGELIGSSDAKRQTWILVAGKLRLLPAGLQFIIPASSETLNSELFSDATRRQMTHEKELLPRQSDTDESVASFVTRHFGEEFLQRVAEPMLAGIYGGDSARLSARAVMLRFVEMERAHGSLQRALTSMKKSDAAKKPVFTSLRTGMESLAAKIAENLEPARVLLSSPVTALSNHGNAWEIRPGSAAHRFDAVIVAIPASVAAQILKAQHGALSSELGAITYASSTTVALAYDLQAANFPSGFGVLVPRSEQRQMMACTFVHNKFPGRVPSGKSLVRLFFGGNHAGTLSDDELISLARTELDQIFAVKLEPEFAMVARWPRSMPQYEVGHLERVAKVRQLVAQFPGLALCGSAYEGVGVPDCVRGGREAARQVLTNLQSFD